MPLRYTSHAYYHFHRRKQSIDCVKMHFNFDLIKYRSSLSMAYTAFEKQIMLKWSGLVAIPPKYNMSYVYSVLRLIHIVWIRYMSSQHMTCEKDLTHTKLWIEENRAFMWRCTNKKKITYLNFPRTIWLPTIHLFRCFFSSFDFLPIAFFPNAYAWWACNLPRYPTIKIEPCEHHIDSGSKISNASDVSVCVWVVALFDHVYAYVEQPLNFILLYCGCILCSVVRAFSHTLYDV